MPKAYALPAPGKPFDPHLFKLGKPCKRNHIHAIGLTLRYRKRNTCPLCERIDGIQRQNRRRQENPELFKQKRREYVANSRKLIGRKSRSRYGLPHGVLERYGLHQRQSPQFAELVENGYNYEWAAQQLILWSRLEAAKAVCTVAQLVADEQRRYWREHPDVYAQFNRERQRLYHQWRHMTDPEYRLYHRQKSKRRKAQMRNSTAHQLSGKQVRRRFAEFDHRCAYCGADGDLHIEHVDPISKGGAHVLSNIVPACKACNYSKHTYEVERWYRAQPFFTEQRWQAICAVTDAGLLPVPIQLGPALVC